MDTSAIDFPALALAVTIALAITIALAWAERSGSLRRAWIMAGALGAVFIAIGLFEILTATPREVHIATVLVGVPVPVLGALGLIRATRRVRAWIRWPVVFLTTLVLLFAGLLLGAAVLPRYVS